MRKVGMIAHIDHGKTSLTNAIAFLTKGTPMAADTLKTKIIKAAHAVGVAEEAAAKIGDHMEAEGYSVTQSEPAPKVETKKSELKVQPAKS